MSIIKQYREAQLAKLGKLIDRKNEISFEYEIIEFVKANNTEITFDFNVFLPSKNINLQRELVWTDEQKRELIKSIILQKHIPAVTVITIRNKNKTTHEVIDGKQRLNTIISFMRNEFSIILEGQNYFYSDFGKEFNFCLDLRARVYYSHADDKITDDQKIALFKLLNFAGTPQDEEHLKMLN